MADELHWSIEKSDALYGIHRWSQGMFTINELGHMCLRASPGGQDIDLRHLVQEIQMRGLKLPVLIRFTDILRRRMDELADAFGRAAQAHDYKGLYRGVYPIKVNQHRHVLDDLIKLGRRHHFGLEVGSKAELLVAVALLDDPEAMMICNGFKDRDFIETALAARQLGQQIFLVVEKASELPSIMAVARELKVEPLIGLRVRLAAIGSGRWARSSGDRSKFGLQAAEIVDAVKLLKRRKMLQHLQLLHFHIGSQVTNIKWVKGALREASSIFVELRRLGAPIRFVDVGGGLAVDYDGSQTDSSSSANYTPAEYASCVVEALSRACEEGEIPHPTIISESGRALTAHHSVLVVQALSTDAPSEDLTPPTQPKGVPQPVGRMEQILLSLSRDNVQEVYHDAVQARSEALMLFNMRQLSLENRAFVERTFRVICHRIHGFVQDMPFIPEELADLQETLTATYFCNFSLFQSLPDHWAIKQLFPVAPLHRLAERPTQHGVIADATCDSDGRMDQFVDLEDVARTLPLHELREGEPYYLGFFLIGAYQEVLGDLHNLLGDTNVVHISSGPEGHVIEKTVEGDSVIEVLSYLQYNRQQLLDQLRGRVDAALRSGVIKSDKSALFLRDMEDRLDAYTYLQPETNRTGRRPN